MLPETHAAQRLALICQRTDDLHTLKLWEQVGCKLVADRDTVRQILDELDSDPSKLPLSQGVLRRQQTNRLDDADVFDEAAYYAQQEADANRVMAAAARRGHRDGYDPDERDADRDASREREAAQDQAAQENAPKVAS